MELVLELTDFAQASHGMPSSRTFGVDGGVIGRSSDCTWIIGESHKYVSNHHANVSFRDGHFYLTDSSSNGIWLDDGRIKLNRGQPHRIEQGDCFRLADLEIRARLSSKVLPEGYTLGERQDASAMLSEICLDPVAAMGRAEASSTYGEELSDLFQTEVAEERLQPGPVERQSLVIPELMEADGLRAEIEHAPMVEDFWGRFGQALGLDLRHTDTAVCEGLALNVAQQLKSTLEGLEQCLRTCDELRSELGLSAVSRDRAVGWSASVQQILSGLSPSASSRESAASGAINHAFRDLQAHQIALLAASRNVARAALEAFAPSHLKLRFEREDDRPWLATNGSHWRAFERYHQSLMDNEQRRAGLFARDFARTYEEQARLLATLHLDYPG